MRTERDFAPERQEGRRRFMIAGEHVILRAFEREDAERCYRWMNDPNIVRTLKSRYPLAFQSEMEWVELAIQASSSERHFAIERRDDRSHIGNASIHDIDWVSRTGWFGLFIGEPTAWNRGFGGDDLFRRLPQSGVDHFHAGVAQCARDDFRAAIVAVESGLRDQHADFFLAHDCGSGTASRNVERITMS